MVQLALVTEASTTAMGAVLQQRAQSAWQPLAFFSRKLSLAQQKYGTYDRELLAIYEAVRYFRHTHEARHFTILMGDKPPSPSNKGGTSVRQGSSTNYTLSPSSRRTFVTYPAKKTSLPTRFPASKQSPRP